MRGVGNDYPKKKYTNTEVNEQINKQKNKQTNIHPELNK